MALHIETPLLESTPLSSAASCKVFLKMENSQPAGSFKLRGLGRHCSEEKKAGKTSVICSSGGNAGFAAAYASRKLDMPCVIFVPESTPQFMVERLKAEGADVEVRGRIWNEANEAALELLKSSPHAAFIHPFDHPQIWKGNATMIHEIKKQMGASLRPDCIVASVGGGGLLTGIIEGMDDVGWSDIPVVAMETDGAASLSAAMKAGEVVTIPDITSIAKSLGSTRICQQLFDYTKNHRIISETVSDKQAVDACLQFADDHRILVEPACGASLALIYSAMLKTLQREGKLPSTLHNIVIIVCGGNIVTMETLNDYRATLG